MKENLNLTFSRRLRTQLMMVFVIMLSVLIGTVSILSYTRSKKIIQEQSANTIQQYFLQNQYSILDYTKEVENLLRLLIIQESLPDYMRGGWADQYETIRQASEIFDYTSKLMGNYEYIDSVYYYGNDGTAMGVLTKKNLLTKEKDTGLSFYSLGIDERVSKNLGEIQWLGGYTSEDFVMEDAPNGETKVVYPYITAAGGLWLGEGRYVTVIINIRQRVFANLFTKSDEPDGRESYLMNQAGTIIVHKDVERVGEKAELTPIEIAKEGKDYLMSDGYQINYHMIPGLDWTIVSEISTATLYGNLETLKMWFIVVALGGAVTAFALSAYWLYRLTVPLNHLRTAMEKMEKGALGEQLDESSRNELGMLGRQFNRMSRSIETMIEQIRDMEEEKRILEKEALQGQLNPHFLFNTLSNMRIMSKIGEKETLEECFGALGNMLQPMYRNEGELWSLRQELDYMHNYTTIMNHRFGGKVTVSYEIAADLEQYMVLKFILQPLVENSISHGFSALNGEGDITIGAIRKEEQLIIYVEDNGSGITKERQEELLRLLDEAGSKKELYKENVGLINVHRRLLVHFGEDYGIRIESIPGDQTCIYLVMPVVEP